MTVRAVGAQHPILGPQAGAEKAYQLLVSAMHDRGSVALAQFVHHGKEHLVLIRPKGEGLVLHTMHYADEVRKFEDVETLGPQKIKPAEIDLAKAELQIRAQNAAIGIGLFVVAGLLSLYGLGWLLNSAALGLANVVPAWLAALIVGVVLLALTATLALLGKRALSRGMPPTPERATENVKRDIEAVKEGLRS